MKKSFIVFLILFLVGGSLVFYLTRKKEKALYGSGMIEVQEITVSSKIGGIIQEFKVNEGDKVKKGDTLIIIEHKELLIKKKEAIASISLALETLKGIEAQRKNIEKNVKRLRALSRTGSVPEKDLELLETQLETLKSQENAARARLKQANAALELVESQIKDAYISTPIKGIVLSKNFEEGEMVFPGSSLLTIGNLERAWIKVYVSERDVGKISINSRALVYVDTYPEEAFEGRVSWIAKKAEFTPRNIQTRDERAQLVFAVKITIENPESKLFPGMPAEARLESNETK